MEIIIDEDTKNKIDGEKICSELLLMLNENKYVVSHDADLKTIIIYDREYYILKNFDPLVKIHYTQQLIRLYPNGKELFNFLESYGNSHNYKKMILYYIPDFDDDFGFIKNRSNENE